MTRFGIKPTMDDLGAEAAIKLTNEWGEANHPERFTPKGERSWEFFGRAELIYSTPELYLEANPDFRRLLNDRFGEDNWGIMIKTNATYTIKRTINVPYNLIYAREIPKAQEVDKDKTI